MSNTQRATVPDTPHADDELLTMQEVANVVRVPVATLRYWALTPGCGLRRREVGHQQDAHPDPERTLPGALRRRRARERADPCHCGGRTSHRRSLGY
jgi:hypothetical protein